MTTRRQRLESKVEKRHEWAGKASARADARFAGVSAIADNIPCGQPVLLGHHSEGRHRRDIARIDNGMRKGCEEQALSAHHASKASGLEAQLEHTIFTDDADAVEKIEARIAENEAKRDQMKLINKLFSKGDAAGLTAIGLDLEKLRAQVAGNFSWDKRPYASYSLTNLGARIRADKVRLEEVRRQQVRTAKVEATDDGVLVEGTGDYVRVTFAEKPDRSILDSLRAANFRWGGGSWTGRRDALPASVAP